MKKNIIISILTIVSICFGCSDWLSLEPSDRISEKNNYSEITGFKKALNGIYIELNRSNLYGRSLSCEFIEILAQRYNIDEDSKTNKELMLFNYGGAGVKGRISSIWESAYSLIANINTLLKNCEEHKEAISEEYYNIIKGEALGLRALLHFDLFRLFGPLYDANSKTKTIPYYKSFNFNVAESVTSSEYMNNVITDLLEADKLLRNDPIIKKGVSGDFKDIFLQYRNLRLNSYGVKSILSRAYLYIGDTEKSYEFAKSVIDIQAEKFPWVMPMKLTGGKDMDRIFHTEIIFATQNLDRHELFTRLFDGQNLKPQTLLAPKEGVTNKVFEHIKTDYRYVSSLNNSMEIQGVQYKIFNKYQGKDSLFNQMIPLIRVSELYLIAAETAPTNEEKLTYFNTLRNNRGLTSVKKIRDVQKGIPKEWVKEFYGEGQLFFYYKRTKTDKIQSATSEYGTVQMDLRNYVLPIPEGEVKYN